MHSSVIIWSEFVFRQDQRWIPGAIWQQCSACLMAASGWLGPIRLYIPSPLPPTTTTTPNTWHSPPRKTSCTRRSARNCCCTQSSESPSHWPSSGDLNIAIVLKYKKQLENFCVQYLTFMSWVRCHYLVQVSRSPFPIHIPGYFLPIFRNLWCIYILMLYSTSHSWGIATRNSCGRYFVWIIL